MTKKEKIKIINKAIEKIESNPDFACLVLSIYSNELGTEFSELFKPEGFFFGGVWSFSTLIDTSGMLHSDDDYSLETKQGHRTRLIALELFKLHIKDNT